ncbi:hypothetical protein CYLTODRAFT_426474 [Cylindrobasidium torrendii FP15055 ss-10]|uniref:Uncharacterized protein n=1 Tax=Cylindrobasidium torrendii FP15055 ss-10 TaxID=1314674 RepID=A0A0D7AYN3_9AGAR|nr:hypothetical protein CYLTODRAFT_426474 [Cylindrobasidium torrendii FP15055 ss-10]
MSLVDAQVAYRLRRDERIDVAFRALDDADDLQISCRTQRGKRQPRFCPVRSGLKEGPLGDYRPVLGYVRIRRRCTEIIEDSSRHFNRTQARRSGGSVIHPAYGSSVYNLDKVVYTRYFTTTVYHS